MRPLQIVLNTVFGAARRFLGKRLFAIVRCPPKPRKDDAQLKLGTIGDGSRAIWKLRLIQANPGKQNREKAAKSSEIRDKERPRQLTGYQPTFPVPCL